MPNNPITTQPVESNWIGEANQQLIISKQITTNKTLEKILRDVNEQVLETKYTLNLGQLLQVIPDIKCYILNPIPSKLILL